MDIGNFASKINFLIDIKIFHAGIKRTFFIIEAGCKCKINKNASSWLWNMNVVQSQNRLNILWIKQDEYKLPYLILNVGNDDEQENKSWTKHSFNSLEFHTEGK